MKIVLPLYIYPINSSWQPYYNAIQQYPQLSFTIIINPNSGPGTSPGPNSDYKTALSKLASYSNVNTVGYVKTNYGNKTINDVKAEIDVYNSWSGGIRPKGLFFDQTPLSNYTHMNIISSYARKTNTGQTIIFNPGESSIDNTYFNIADLVCTFAQSYPWYLQYPPALLGSYASQSIALLYNATTFSSLQDLVTTFGQSNWASVFVTDRPDPVSAYTITGLNWSNYTFLMNQTRLLRPSSTSAVTSTSGYSSLAITSMSATSSTSVLTGESPPTNSNASSGNAVLAGASAAGVGVLAIFCYLAYRIYVRRRSRRILKNIAGLSKPTTAAQITQLQQMITTSMTVFNHQRFVTQYEGADKLTDIDFRSTTTAG